MKHSFTTGEVAKLLHVATGTVVRWFDRGKLKGYFIGGSRNRRIPRASLISFCREHGLPTKELECPGHERGGQGEPCCERAGEYNGFGSDGPTTFTCPHSCSCHD